MSPRLSDLLLSSQSDERLVSLAREGHERAFAAIVERYRPELQAMARRLCSDGRSEDVVQQAFLSAFMALRSGCEVRHLRGWLYRILRNTAGRSDTPAFVPLDGGTPSVHGLEEIVQQRATAMTALSEIARLPARQRQAMIGTALDGRARAEVANSMGLSEGAVRQLVHRARTTLRSAVTAVTPWPLARWIVAAGPDAPSPGELAAGAGAASSGGLALKLGALLASGTFLTGAAVHLQARPAHRGDARAATSVHPRPALARAHPVAVASVVAPSLGREALPMRRTASPAQPMTRVVASAGARQRIWRNDRHGETSAQPASPTVGSRVGGHDDGRGDRNDPAGSGGGGRRDGSGAGTSSPTSSATNSDGHVQDGGSGGGSSTVGTDGSSGSSGGDTGSDDGSAQIVSDSQSLDASLDGSDSGQGSVSGSGSSSGDGSTSTSGSGSDGGSGSGGGGTAGELSSSGDGGGTSGG
ncbi:MAG TPA: sigma-70 family RNA polymerase sigma factor [Solirubrobacteraceae bacterium]|nr:sigma-70 family RNA polymerase sigma factor [Solirubrobacteraceae bacterium]